MCTTRINVILCTYYEGQCESSIFFLEIPCFVTKNGCHLRKRRVTTDRNIKETPLDKIHKPKASLASPRDTQTLTTPGLRRFSSFHSFVL